MKVTILDDYCDTLRTLACFRKLNRHRVDVWTDHAQDTDVLAERLKDTEVCTCSSGLASLRVNGLALRSGRPGMAAVDVDEHEPVRDPASDVFDQIVAYAGGHPINVVNPEVLERRPRSDAGHTW